MARPPRPDTLVYYRVTRDYDKEDGKNAVKVGNKTQNIKTL
ncbi:hypothetical protein [Carboxylicivirga linearis]|nr:hypothetical protein [Carboxylicivirga linearis]